MTPYSPTLLYKRFTGCPKLWMNLVEHSALTGLVRFLCNILRVRGPSLIENGQKTSFDNDKDRLHE